MAFALIHWKTIILIVRIALPSLVPMKRSFSIFAFILFLVFFFVARSEYWTYSLWRAMDRVPTATALPRSEGVPEPIAHAAGVVRGRVYTNSREALERSLNEGYRYIELDLRKTIGGDYFAAHRYREFYEMTGGALLNFLPPTRERVVKSLLFGELHPLFLEDACKILREQDAWLVTDKARDFGALLQACPMPERMIVEVSNLNQYFAALDAGIRYPALNTHRLDEAMAAGVKIAVVTPETYERSPERDEFLRVGGSLLVASSERCSEYPTLFGRPGTWVYTDRCAPARK